jgi:hypothetical protein
MTVIPKTCALIEFGNLYIKMGNLENKKLYKI